jgi:IclR family pca regulon transcriptional regulator
MSDRQEHPAPAQGRLKPGEHVESLARGLAVIRAFGAGAPRQTLSAVAARAGVSRAAARRLLLTLESLGYVACEDGKHFSLRPAVLDLGFAYLASQPWWREAQRHIGPLATRLGHSCAIGVLDRLEVVYVAYAAPNPVAGLDRSVGTRLPAHATAIGRVLLAGLDEGQAAALLGSAPLPAYSPFTSTDPAKLLASLAAIRRDGCCLVDQELRLGLRSFGVPILGRDGRVRAGLSMSYGLLDQPEEAVLLRELRATAEAIGRSLAD